METSSLRAEATSRPSEEVAFPLLGREVPKAHRSARDEEIQRRILDDSEKLEKLFLDVGGLVLLDGLRDEAVHSEVARAPAKRLPRIPGAGDKRVREKAQGFPLGGSEFHGAQGRKRGARYRLYRVPRRPSPGLFLPDNPQRI